MGDQVQFEEAGLGVAPLGEGADGDLVLEPGAGAGRREAPVGQGAPKGRQEAARVAGLTWRRCLSTSGVTPTSPLRVRRSSSSGRKGCQRWGPMWPVASESRWAAAATAGPYRRGRPSGATRSRAQRASQQADSRLAMQPGDRHHLGQQPVFFRPRRAQVTLPLHGGILPQTGSRHGHLLVGVGNRDL